MEQKLRVSEKLLGQIKTLELRSEESVKMQADIEPKLALIVKRTKELKSQVCILTLCYEAQILFLKSQKTLIEFSNFECGLLTKIIVWCLLDKVKPSTKIIKGHNDDKIKNHCVRGQNKNFRYQFYIKNDINSVLIFLYMHLVIWFVNYYLFHWSVVNIQNTKIINRCRNQIMV